MRSQITGYLIPRNSSSVACNVSLGRRPLPWKSSVVNSWKYTGWDCFINLAALWITCRNQIRQLTALSLSKASHRMGLR